MLKPLREAIAAHRIPGVQTFEVACVNGKHAYTVQVPNSYPIIHFRPHPRFCVWCPPKLPRSKPREGVPVEARLVPAEAA